MSESLPSLLVPGLLCSARLYAPQIPVLWRFGPVVVADHTRDDSMTAIAARILGEAPPRFRLIGLSMGGYICQEIMRQAPERIDRVALLDTTAQPEKPEQTEVRRAQVALARAGRLDEVTAQQHPRLVHRDRLGDGELRAIVELMAEEVGAEAFERQQTAIMSRSDMRPNLARFRRPALVLVGDADELIPLEHSRELAEGIPGAQLVVVPACGHLSTLEQPWEVNRALIEWIDAS